MTLEGSQQPRPQGSLLLFRSVGRVGENPGNEVGVAAALYYRVSLLDVFVVRQFLLLF